MAIPAKGSRHITVDGQRYTWVASGNDGWIDLIICASSLAGQKLRAKFEYHHTIVSEGTGSYHIVPGSQFVVTPAVVGKVILHSLAHGWRPLIKGADLHIGLLDEAIGATGRFLSEAPTSS